MSWWHKHKNPARRIGIRTAAIKFGVPEPTLRRYIKTVVKAQSAAATLSDTIAAFQLPKIGGLCKRRLGFTKGQNARVQAIYKFLLVFLEF